MKKKRVIIYTIMFLAIFFTISQKAFAAPNLSVSLDGGDTPTDYVTNIKLLIFLTILTLLPSFIVMVTSFTRIAVVLSFLKNAIGAQQAIPSQVMVGLSLFLTLFIMQPVYNEINTNALQPYMENKITQEQAIEAGSKPLREFMIKQTRPKDLELFVETSKIDTTDLTKDNVPLYVVIPAFVISELKTAFTIGFLIFLPFLIIDMVVASVLMSMGMFMLPPVMVSLPFKLLLFAMVDGWYLVVKSLIMSFA
ncbi:flagellar type III secretion system pore protein FliP [Clostridium sp. YIM B02506]|nr:flagellar type III secretion system pore protein FliP [Clostridium sp. YIM B02506]